MIQGPKVNGHALLELAFRIAPADRKEWFAAMAAEFDHVPASRRGQFTIGCVWAAIRERMTSPAFLHATARTLLIGGALIWAALNIRFAGRMSVTNTLEPEALGYGTAIVFIMGALATARFGYRATIALAPPLIALLFIAAIVLRLGSPPSPMSQLYVALLIEDLVILAVAVLVAAFAATRIRVAREHA